MPNYIKLFTPVDNWLDAPSGTLGFYQGSSLLSKEISKLEPGSISSFTPSHVFIKFDDAHVVEAILDIHQNSVAAVDASAKYIDALKAKNVRLLIPPGNMQIWHNALLWLINTYGSQPYGVSVLFGFLAQKLFHLNSNPLGQTGDVCSQAGWLYLQRGMQSLGQPHRSYLAAVLTQVPLADAAPLNLFEACSKRLFVIE